MPLEEAPYDNDGNLLSYVSRYYDRGYQAPIMQPNIPFKAVMTLDGIQRGQSSALFILKNEQGRKFPMFMSQMADLLQRAGMAGGKTDELTWHVVKRGQNYSLAYLLNGF